MSEQTVCDINFYIYTRLMFGYYHEFTAERARRIAKCYCFVVTMAVLASTGYALLTNVHSNSVVYFATGKYLLFVIVSARKKNEYLLRYYKKLPLVDDAINANRYSMLRIYLISAMCLLFIVKLFIYFGLMIVMFHSNNFDFVSSFDLIMGFAEFYEWFNLLFIFGLLYCRVRNMREMLESNSFECRSQGRHHPRSYILMYHNIMDSFEKTDDPMKLLISIHVILKVPDSLQKLISFFAILKKYNQDLDVLVIIVLNMDTLVPYIPLILSAILADLTTDELEEISAIVVEKRIDCEHERDRDEIQKLLKCMRNQPFSYTLWRVVPLNLRSLLTFVSFSVTTVIAVLQIIGFAN